MLRIRVDDQPMAATFHVEGKLVGDSVEELRKVWTATHTLDPQKQTVVELTSVLVVDAAGPPRLSAAAWRFRPHSLTRRA